MFLVIFQLFCVKFVWLKHHLIKLSLLFVLRRLLHDGSDLVIAQVMYSAIKALGLVNEAYLRLDEVRQT